MPVRTYKFHCEFCSYRSIMNGSDSEKLRGITLAPVPKGHAKRGHIKRPKVYCCPKCGRGIKAKRIDL
jgi:hypothetical protein